MNDAAAATTSRLDFAARGLSQAGVNVARYGIVAILIFIGGLKFTADEAKGIEPLVAHSPLLFWLYHVTSVRGASDVIGTCEIAIALAIALRPFAPLVSGLGSALATLTFATTASFLLSTPGVWEPAFPLLSGTGSFLVKDVVLLGAAAFTAGEAFAAAAQRVRTR